MQNTRRELLRAMGLGALSIITLPNVLRFTKTEKMTSRTIPSSGEELPIVGLGTWQTFDVGTSGEDLTSLREVLVNMQKMGGKLIDSSPMYGSSEAVVGRLTSELQSRDAFFYATKVWTEGEPAGIDQMNASFDKMRRKRMDLMQIHNLVDWQTHVKTLRKWKEEGKIRYWGLTHYLDSAHKTLGKIIRQERPDFVQFNYSIGSRNAETTLFKTCQEYQTATIINQPFESGSLFRKTKGKELPDWAVEYDINSWGQYFLKFILSNQLLPASFPAPHRRNM